MRTADSISSRRSPAIPPPRPTRPAVRSCRARCHAHGGLVGTDGRRQMRQARAEQPAVGMTNLPVPDEQDRRHEAGRGRACRVTQDLDVAPRGRAGRPATVMAARSEPASRPERQPEHRGRASRDQTTSTGTMVRTPARRPRPALSRPPGPGARARGAGPRPGGPAHGRARPRAPARSPGAPAVGRRGVQRSPATTSPAPMIQASPAPPAVAAAAQMTRRLTLGHRRPQEPDQGRPGDREPRPAGQRR